MDTPRGGIKLGTFVGAPVILSPSWFLIAAFVVFTFAPTVRDYLPDLSPGANYVVAATYAVLLLLSVLVHELAHAVLARAYNLPVTQIVADLWGGHTQFAAEANRPTASAVISCGGPAANLVLAGVGLLVKESPDGVVALLGNALFVANLLLAIFNLLPGLPLDGGRVVESLFWGLSGERSTGTVVAGWLGRGVAVGVLLLGFVLPLVKDGDPDPTLLIWSALISGLLWTGATQALRWGGMRRRATRLDARALARPGGTGPRHLDDAAEVGSWRPTSTSPTSSCWTRTASRSAWWRPTRSTRWSHRSARRAGPVADACPPAVRRPAGQHDRRGAAAAAGPDARRVDVRAGRRAGTGRAGGRTRPGGRHGAGRPLLDSRHG